MLLFNAADRPTCFALVHRVFLVLCRQKIAEEGTCPSVGVTLSVAMTVDSKFLLAKQSGCIWLLYIVQHTEKRSAEFLTLKNRKGQQIKVVWMTLASATRRTI